MHYTLADFMREHQAVAALIGLGMGTAISGWFRQRWLKKDAARRAALPDKISPERKAMYERMATKVGLRAPPVTIVSVTDISGGEPDGRPADPRRPQLPRGEGP